MKSKGHHIDLLKKQMENKIRKKNAGLKSIPYVPDGTSYNATPDIYSTTDQVLGGLSGAANVPIRDALDNIQYVFNRLTSDENQIGLNGITDVPNTYPTLSAINVTSVYKIPVGSTFPDLPVVSGDGDIIQSFAYGVNTMPMYQVYYSIASVGFKIYYRCQGSIGTMTNWNTVASENYVVQQSAILTSALTALINQLGQQTISSYGAFLSEDSSNGIPITSVNSSYPCYIGNGQIVYRNGSDGSKLYLKSATGTDNGTVITNVQSFDPCYIGNGKIVYRNASDGGKLYLKSSTGTDNGTAITSVLSDSPCYIGNGQIVYTNSNDGGKLYLKSATGTDNGTVITNVQSSDPCYIGNGQIVYRNNDDGNKLYLKSATGTDNGTAITSVRSYYPCYIGNGQIVYRNWSDDKLYLKSATGTDNGTVITSISSYYPCYIGNGQIVYVDENTRFLRLKSLFLYK